jgi:hypothetical protein
MKKWKVILAVGVAISVSPLISSAHLWSEEGQGDECERHISSERDRLDLIPGKSRNTTSIGSEEASDAREKVDYVYAHIVDIQIEEPRTAEASVNAVASSYLRSIVNGHGYAEVENGMASVLMECIADAISSADFEGKIVAEGDSGKSSIDLWLSASPLSSKIIAEITGEATEGSVKGEASGLTESLERASGYLFIYGEGAEVRAHGFMLVFSIGPLTFAYTFAWVVALDGEVETDLSRPLRIETKGVVSRIMELMGFDLGDVEIEIGDNFYIDFDRGRSRN